MARARTLTLKTQVDVTGADKLDNLGRKMQKTGAILTAGVTLPLLALGKAATDAASDLNESLNAVNVTFGDSADEIAKIGETSAESFGLSQRAFNEAATQFSAFAHTIAGEGGDVVGVVEDITQRASDFASVFNIEVEDALRLFQSGLAGETEPLRKFGVDLSAAAVEAHALAAGISDGVGPLSEAEKVQARYSLLLEETVKTQGDFANTADEAANAARIMGARVEDAAANLGQKFLPVKQKVIEVLSDALDAWDKLPDSIQNSVVMFGAAAAALGPLLVVLGSLVRAVSTLAPLFARLSKVTAPILAIGSAAKLASGDLESLLDVADAFDPFGTLGAVRTLAEGLESDLAAPVHDAAITWAESWAAIQDSAFDGTLDTAASIAAGAEVIEDEMEELADAVSPGVLADSIRAGIGDYNNALEELAEATVTNINDLESRAQIEASLASKTLTDALNSDSTRTRLQALELVNDLVADYELIAPGALDAGELVNPALTNGLYSNLGMVRTAAGSIAATVEGPIAGMNAYPWGFQIGDSLARGMWDSMHLISAAAYEMANRVSRSVRIESEPPDPNSPLHGITKWGGNLVRTYAEGIRNAVPNLTGASRLLAGAVTVGAGAAMVPSSAASGTGVTVINNFYLQWDGEPPRGRDEAEIIRNLQRLSPLAGGKLAEGYG